MDGRQLESLRANAERIVKQGPADRRPEALEILDAIALEIAGRQLVEGARVLGASSEGSLRRPVPPEETSSRQVLRAGDLIPEAAGRHSG